MTLNNKGQMRTVEAFLSILLMFSAFSIATQISPPSGLSNYNSLEALGFQTLLTIDNDGQLGELIDKRNWTALTHILNLILPMGTSYNLTVYNTSQHSINDIPISNGIISDGNIVSIRYPCVSPDSQCSHYLLLFQIATAE